MSAFIFNEHIKRPQKIMGFIEFISLSEAISPVQVDYGKNYKDHQWYEFGDSKLTFYAYRNRAYCVVIDDGDVGFMSAEGVPDVSELGANTIEEFGFDRTKSNHACTTFNQFFYIILQGIKRFDLSDVSFKGADSGLGNLYSKVVKNPFFLKQLNTLGFDYHYDSREDKHIFVKR